MRAHREHAIEREAGGFRARGGSISELDRGAFRVIKIHYDVSALSQLESIRWTEAAVKTGDRAGHLVTYYCCRS